MSGNNNLVKTLGNLVKILETPKDEFSNFLSTAPANPVTDKINETLQRRRQEQQDQVTTEAAEEIMSLMSESDNAIGNSRVMLSDARRAVALNIRKIERVAVARRYGERTMNWLPPAFELGKVTAQVIFASHGQDVLYIVPDEEFNAILAEIKNEQAKEKAITEGNKVTATGKVIPTKVARNTRAGKTAAKPAAK